MRKEFYQSENLTSWRISMIEYDIAVDLVKMGSMIEYDIQWI